MNDSDNRENLKLTIQIHLQKMDKEIMNNLSLNTAISLYDIVGEFYSDENKFELKLAQFFAGIPDKIKLLSEVIGDISLIRQEIIKGGENNADLKEFVENYFYQRSSELNKQWKNN